MRPTYRSINLRCYRMLTIRWQREPYSGAGAALNGGRWNRLGLPALYLALEHSTAIAEFYQDLVRPGTLAAYEVGSTRIIDLTDSDLRQSLGLDAAAMLADWEAIADIEGRDPPTWTLADRLIMDGAHGALAPSMRQRSGTNLVLWRWQAGDGEGACVRLVDPHGDLG